jgi:LacI family transcriptional regulator
MQKPKSFATDSTFLPMVSGISEELACHGVDLVLHTSVDDGPVAPYRRLVGKGTLDGYILSGPQPRDARIEFLQSGGTPFVVHGKSSADATYPFCDIDNAGASRLAVELLCDLGHERIALINGPSALAFSTDRRAGFDSGAAARGRRVNPEWIVSGPMSESAGYLAALRMLNRLEHRPTAFVCSSTLVARGVYRAAADSGLQIPADLSVVAHDDDVPDVPAASFNPPLTVTFSPLTDACGPLVEALLAAIKGETANLQRVLIPELIVRQSTGRAS